MWACSMKQTQRRAGHSDKNGLRVQLMEKSLVIMNLYFIAFFLEHNIYLKI